MGDGRGSLPIRPGSDQKIDSGYIHNGTCIISAFVGPLGGRHHVNVRGHRIAADWAGGIKYLVDMMYPDAEKIIVVMGNLNTHKTASLYKRYPASGARRIIKELELHSTPKHGSWLNIAGIEHIFSELYSVPGCLLKPYFKLKVQELLLFLCMVDVSKEKHREQYTFPQVEIVKEIHKKLVSDLQMRPTIEELSKEYLINTATLKDTFKGIYGQPIGAYMKGYRMKQAAILLRQTQASIAEIVDQVGYEDQSKFAAAFRDVLRIAPAEYRKQNSGTLQEKSCGLLIDNNC